MYICPVCGYEKLDEPPVNFSICSCCGTEFEYDDFDTPYSTLRARWAANGYRWFSPIVLPPDGWNPLKQLSNLHYMQALHFSAKVEEIPPLQVEAVLDQHPHTAMFTTA